MNRSIIYYILFCINITCFMYAAQPATNPLRDTQPSTNPLLSITDDPGLEEFIEGIQTQSEPCNASPDRRMSASVTLPREAQDRRMSASVGGTEHLAPARTSAFCHNRTETSFRPEDLGLSAAPQQPKHVDAPSRPH